MDTIGKGWETDPPKKSKAEIREALKLEARSFANTLEAHALEVRRVVGSAGTTPDLLDKAAKFLRKLAE